MIKMKNGLKVFLIMLCAFVIFCSGTCIAYYNTRVYGFDTQASLVTVGEEKITFMDFEIYYSSIEDKAETIKKLFSDRSYTVLSKPCLQ